MTHPYVAQLEPYAVEVKAGKTYFWCACGKSSRQPFCDGSHKDTGIEPLKWECGKDGKKFFCGCKMTDGQPFCDGTHNKL
ncbi:MAG: CDGSH iron-sulfur domain-containing protein [Pseudomonadota bacterium]